MASGMESQIKYSCAEGARGKTNANYIPIGLVIEMPPPRVPTPVAFPRPSKTSHGRTPIAMSVGIVGRGVSCTKPVA